MAENTIRSLITFRSFFGELIHNRRMTVVSICCAVGVTVFKLLTKWLRILFVLYGDIVTNKEGWLWLNPVSYSPVLIRSSMMEGHLQLLLINQPLGGNRIGKLRNYLNLLIVFLPINDSYSMDLGTIYFGS